MNRTKEMIEEALHDCDVWTALPAPDKTAHVLAAAYRNLEAERDRLREALAEWEVFREAFDNLEYHYEGMGCGIEDRGITDRYRACEYGWGKAIERIREQIPEHRAALLSSRPCPRCHGGAVRIKKASACKW
jgi:hypothetical protein